MMKVADNLFNIRKRNISRKDTRKQKIRLWLLVIAAMVFFVCLWWAKAERDARVVPDYPKVKIEGYLQQEHPGDADYEIIFQQTGLARVAVEKLLQEDRQPEILLAQENLFREVEITCVANTIISREERCEEGLIPYVEDGDILITFNSHVFGWRNGHAAIVVDAEQRQTLEARVLGMDSAIMSMEHWEKYPSFVVLRLKGATQEERKKIAEYAKENLVGVPYRLNAGWKKNGTKEIGTHCSHLVWYAYQHFGYNLDSDGGLIVTPNDIFESSLLEPVQVYGMNVLEQQRE